MTELAENHMISGEGGDASVDLIANVHDCPAT